MSPGTALVVPTTAPTNLAEREKEGGSLVERAREIKVTSEKTYEEGGQFMRIVKTYDRAVRAEFKPIEDAHRAAAKATKAFKDKALLSVVSATDLVDPQMKAFQKKKREIREAQEKKQQEEAEAKALKEREEEKKRLAKQAENDPDAKEKLEELEDTPIVTDAVVEKRPIKKVDGVAAKQIWKFKVTDKQALLRACAAGECSQNFIKIDQVEIGKVVRASKGDVKIPGISPYPEESTSYGSV